MNWFGYACQLCLSCVYDTEQPLGMSSQIMAKYFLIIEFLCSKCSFVVFVASVYK